MTIADQMNDEVVTDFVEFCACRGIDPEMALRFLGTHDWKAGKIDSGITDEQRREINRNLVGDPTMEQTQAIFRSVMASK